MRARVARVMTAAAGWASAAAVALLLSAGLTALPAGAQVIRTADATVRGLADGAQVRVFNELGDVHCTLAVAPIVRPGTVSLPKGLWRRSTRNGATGTALVPDTLTDLGGGACFNDARVEVQPLEG